MNDRIGACTFIYPGKTIDQGAAIAAALGVKTVDIASGGANTHWELDTILQAPERVGADTRAALARHNLVLNECLALDVGAPINSPNDADRRRTIDRFARLADFAASAGCRSVMLIVGPVQPELGAEDSITRAAHMLNELSELGQQRGVALHVEPDCESCIQHPQSVVVLCEQAPAIRLTLDYSHFIYHGFDQADVEPLHRFTGHVHVRQAAPKHIVADANSGTIDMQRLITQLTRGGYDGLFTVEYLHLPITSRLDVLDQTRRMIGQLDMLLRESE